MSQLPLSGMKLIGFIVVLATVAFLQILDLTIANVALSTVAGNLGASTSQATWVITSFAVANAISIPLSGWLAKRFGEVKLFSFSILFFIIASWLCGISNSLETLIISRIFQGAVSGPIVPLSQSILLANSPNSKKNMSLAIWSMTIIIAPVCGPILGGWISDNFYWGWIFLLNVPIGLIAWISIKIILKGRETEYKKSQIDTIGLVLLVVGIGSLQLVLDRGKELDWFDSSEIVLFSVIAFTTISFFILWEITSDNPIVDLTLFKSRNFTVGTICISLAFLLHIGTLVIQPQLLQRVFSYTATWAGLALAPIGLIPILLSPIIGHFVPSIDMRKFVTVSFVVFACCFFWRAYSFEPNMSFSSFAWPQFVQGFAIACFVMPLNIIILTDIPPHKLAAAGSLFNFFRTLATSVGTSLTNSIWEQREAIHHSQLTDLIYQNTYALDYTYQQLQQQGLSENQVSAKLAQSITNQGLLIASNEIFWLYGIIFLLLIIVIWFAKSTITSKNSSGVD
ncbi:DHA2 family efflux MFS transporter permease subunit [Gilliamella sp. B2776]|uniref:DHA2 family efflux MFS transporter permease subunit n=1 Tax=unclassified Gilliamella TaxID=2685620 RepID=UPI00226AC794|nr:MULTISPECIES: DHA2 family efflux MFS transporter permease subunit [unclassified Gilliamella]MCX8649005.1 DHA2 family efflux MFS transporter permease subunit [Gilliamella sp. B2779]MCX8653119.1 DHA2 family efflux MFS transporter permease subunit [Gilliamella sp. B2737]MCX8655379.1 DHA2 family efflux MFS transporter permease subunit [Gilliamella sp. B2894]MCX8664144.1 DHA2 family efflux MFS transporter permease subunit [Gilliamella sp. B2887]MCX8690817.1 DHA2 family efflux MFS transporter per